jgi:hypothetical protein
MGTLLLVYALRRVRLRRLEIVFGEEFGRFLAYVAAILLVWCAMGLLDLVPVLGPYLGWPWLPALLARLSPLDPLRTLAGVLVFAGCVAGFTPFFYTEAYRLFLRRRFAFPYTSGGRWTLALASFYLSVLSLDILRSLFTTEPAARPTWASAGTLIAYVLVIAGAPLLDRLLLRGGLGGFRGFSLVQLVAVLVLSSLVGDLMRSGSVHLGPLVYASFFRGLSGSIPGVLTLLAGTLLAVSSLRPRWLSWLPRRVPGAAAVRAGRTAPPPAPAAGPPAVASPLRAPRWRRYDRATGKRVDWP